MRIRDQRGFSMAELLVVIAVIGILASIAIPSWISHLSATTLTGAARQVQGGLNQARMLALTTRQNICVRVVPPAGYQFLQGGCAGAAWTGPGTDALGTFRPWASNPVTLAGADAIFTQFGTVNQTTVLTITGPQAQTLTVTVGPSGRVTIP